MLNASNASFSNMLNWPKFSGPKIFNAHKQETKKNQVQVINHTGNNKKTSRNRNKLNRKAKVIPTAAASLEDIFILYNEYKKQIEMDFAY